MQTGDSSEWGGNGDCSLQLFEQVALNRVFQY